MALEGWASCRPLGAAVAPSAAGPQATLWGTPQSQAPPSGEGACRQALVNLCVLDQLLLTLGSRSPHITGGGTGSESRPAQSPEARSRRPSFLLPSWVPSLSSCVAVHHHRHCLEDLM